MDEYREAALKLHQYLLNEHWDGNALAGPDPIGKLNWRITRFVKSYSRWLPWNDNLVYLQGQSYWLRSNLSLFELTREPKYADIVDRSAHQIVQKQSQDGTWEHPPIKGRQGFVSTVESVWACLGLVSAYKGLAEHAYLDAARAGYEGIIDVIGLRRFRDSLAVNYHAHTKEMVPNVTTMLLWLAAELHNVTGDKRYLRHTDDMVRFLEHSQMENGELQYILELRPHFQCYQYNSFQFLDLANYYALGASDQVRAILARMAQYLSTGTTNRGSCRYSCFEENPETNYWTAALAAALRQGHLLGLGNFQDQSERAYHRLLSRQNPEGSFFFSDRNYFFLSDRQSYPRQQAMILYFLLQRERE